MRKPQPGRRNLDNLKSPELKDADFKRMRLAQDIVPIVVDAYERGRGRPKIKNPKKSVTLRLDDDVLAHFKATGPGWQGRMNAALRKAVCLPATSKSDKAKAAHS